METAAFVLFCPGQSSRVESSSRVSRVMSVESVEWIHLSGVSQSSRVYLLLVVVVPTMSFVVPPTMTAIRAPSHM